MVSPHDTSDQLWSIILAGGEGTRVSSLIHRWLGRPKPKQYCAFVGTVVESAIIDIDHWRHYFLILGALWGLMVVSRPALARPTAPA